MDTPESCERLRLPPQTLSLRRFPSDPAGKKHLLPSGELPLELAAQLLSALRGGKGSGLQGEKPLLWHSSSRVLGLGT